MKAAVIHRYGDAEVLEVKDIPKPKVGAKDVLIKVHASSINPVDYKIRSGSQQTIIRYKLPVVLGMDLSGEVVEIGNQVKRFKVGDHVYSSPHHKRAGSYAEFASVHEDQVALKPKNLTFQEAASIPLVALTVWDAFVTKRQLKKGDKVLIHAGSGGVGTIAIQIAKHFGAYVATTCSERNAQMVTELGADQVINYREEQFDDILKDFDYVLDAIGGDTQERGLRILRKGGTMGALNSGLPMYVKKHGQYLGLLRMVWHLISFTFRARFGYGVKSSMILREPKSALLNEITKLLENETIKPVIDRVFPLDDIVEAHRYIETGRARGKIILDHTL